MNVIQSIYDNISRFLTFVLIKIISFRCNIWLVSGTKGTGITIFKLV